LADRTGRVLAGISSLAGNRLFELRDGTFQSTAIGINQDIGDIVAIHQDASGRIWLGTQNGLVLWAGTNSQMFSQNEGLPAPEVRAIADDAAGNLWIGTSGGLASLRNGRITAFRKADGLPSEDISCLLADADGVLWIGTRGNGLIRFHKNKWTHYSTSQGLTGNSIGYMIEDGETNLWLSSNAGLMRASKKMLNDYADGATNAILCRAYTETDGLPTREGTQGSQPAACRTADGRLWFPTTKGLVFLNPATLKINPFQPPVVIESVSVGDREQNPATLRRQPSEAVVPPGQERLEIHYTSLNLGAANQSRFKFSLSEAGREPAWHDAGRAREASFTKLPPGNYQFQVTACNEDGVWNSYPVSLSIIVQPPFWQTWWFRAATVVCLLGLIVGAVYYFSTQKLQRQLAMLKQQEALEQERARIARDLHDQLGANLTQVALLGELAESDKELPDEVEDHARQISQTARETTKALDEIVWAVNPSNDTLEGLITYAGKYAQEYFALAGLRYRVEMPDQLPDAPIAPEIRHNVFLAFKEAVNNVVKHAQATEVHSRLRLGENVFTLEIEDNGRGLGGLEQKSGRNGLRNMRKRMEDVGGKFSIGPAAGRGTIVQLTVPISNR
jgi:signal transduction histidine kinase